MPNAQVVADRFHVAQLVGRELNSVRNQEIRSNRSHLDEAEKTRIQKVLKSSKYALLKPEENLTDKQKATLELVKQASPLLAQMHQQKEALKQLFDTAVDWKEGITRLGDWVAQAEPTFQTSVATINRWLAEIANYFEHRTTSRPRRGFSYYLEVVWIRGQNRA
jgi:transposase